MPGCRCAGDHPRTRREQGGGYHCSQLPQGSSPHSQGTGRGTYSDELPSRIIPALAGNSFVGAVRKRGPRDHPRTRREQKMSRGMPLKGWGSSPHSQGTAAVWWASFCVEGIIPALAGNSSRLLCSRFLSADHPRTRREQHYLMSRDMTFFGSSPHAQGTVYVAGVRPRCVRIIPALAGNSRPAMAYRAIIRDHPRTRREQLVCCELRRCSEGSSPHSQGTV